jgi:hypothetical protein
VPEHNLVDAPQRIQICNWMQKNAQDGFMDPQLMFVTYETYFFEAFM